MNMDLINSALSGTNNYPSDLTTVPDRVRYLEQTAYLKIGFIKTLREWFGISLKDAKELGESVCDWVDGAVTVNINKDALFILAGGRTLDTTQTDLRKGINTCFRNWESLKYNSVQDAIIDFLYRSR